MNFKMVKHVAVLLGAVAVMAGIGSGCGGSESTLTKAEFVKQANAICTQRNQEVFKRLSTWVEEQPNNGAGMTQDELFAGAVRQILLPAVESKINGIESLNAPPQGQHQVDSYLQGMKGALAAVEKQGSSSYVAMNDSIVGFEKPFASAHKSAHSYGMKACESEY